MFVDLNILGVFSTNGFEEELVTQKHENRQNQVFCCFRMLDICWLLKKNLSVKIVLTAEVDLIFLEGLIALSLYLFKTY